MPLFRNETESTDTRLVQRIVGIYERCPDKQGVMRLGLVARMDYSEERPDELLDWSLADASCGYQSLSDRSSKNSTRSSASVYQQPRHSYSAASDLPRPAAVKTQPKESDSERRARLLQEVKKIKVKSDKKRLKKQKQKERKRLEKEKQNPVKNEEGKENGPQSKAVNDTSKNDRDCSVKQLASEQDPDSSDSSEEESSDEDSDTEHDSDDSEELDMTSTFVSKAALIARRKLEQKPERFEKKKIQVKEEVKKSSPDKPIEEPQVEKKDPAAPRSPTFEDNLKISSDLANIGNKCASAGDFNVAVKYFTDAIKYNPTEFKLFGNRSFCFEKMQEYSKALTDAELSLSMCPGWVKGLFRKGRALAGLKRYEEASQAFTEVLKGDSACAEAAQELMRVQITQLMAYGYTRKQSSNALIIHGTVKEALQVLSQLSQQPGAIETGAQVANITGVSPVLSANSIPAPPKSQDAPKAPIMNKPLGPVHNMSNYQNQPKPIPYQAMNTNIQPHYRPDQELFPIWVGNLMYPVPESLITNMFSKAGTIYSVKVLAYKRCAFVNYTKQEFCDEAIRLFHGYELNGIKIAVRYPDRIPHGMGISRSAIKADDLQDENMRLNEYVDGRNAVGSHRPFGPYRHNPNYKGYNHQ